jgi:hypothetical protein
MKPNYLDNKWDGSTSRELPLNSQYHVLDCLQMVPFDIWFDLYKTILSRQGMSPHEAVKLTDRAFRLVVDQSTKDLIAGSRYDEIAS